MNDDFKVALAAELGTRGPDYGHRMVPDGAPFCASGVKTHNVTGVQISVTITAGDAGTTCGFENSSPRPWWSPSSDSTQHQAPYTTGMHEREKRAKARWTFVFGAAVKADTNRVVSAWKKCV